MRMRNITQSLIGLSKMSILHKTQPFPVEVRSFKKKLTS